MGRGGLVGSARVSGGLFEPLLALHKIAPSEVAPQYPHHRPINISPPHHITSNLPNPIRSPEPLDEPPALLKQEAAAQGLADDEFVTLQHGAIITVLDGEVITPELHTLPISARQ
jgi:hypothetical protein